jgi:hypothetical protein
MEYATQSRREQESHLLGLCYMLGGLHRDIAMAQQTGMPSDYLTYLEHERAATEFEFAQLYNQLLAAGSEMVNHDQPPARRPAYVEAFPQDREAHRDSQRRMFAAARFAGLDTENRDAFLEAVNYECGLNLTSRRQMTPEENEYMAMIFDLGYYVPGPDGHSWVRCNPAGLAEPVVRSSGVWA